MTVYEFDYLDNAEDGRDCSTPPCRDSEIAERLRLRETSILRVRRISLAKAKLFDRTGSHGTVILNWTGDEVFEFERMARAFHETGRQAADRLVNLEIGVDGWPLHDFLAYPVVFLYRHALELHMKAIILAGAPVFVLRKQAQIDRNALFNEHSFERLRQDFERVFGEFLWSWHF